MTTTEPDTTPDSVPEPAPAPVPVPAQPMPPVVGWEPPPGFVETRWPGPSYGGGPAAWVSAAVGGLAAAFALPVARGGIGWLIVGLVIVLAVAQASRFASEQPAWQVRLEQVAWAVLSLALLAVGAYLNAWWMQGICMLVALGCFALAVTGGHSVQAILFAAVAPALAFFRAIPWLARGGAAWTRARDKRAISGQTTAAILITVVLLVVFGSLFAWADAAFAGIVKNLIPDLDLTAIRDGVLKFVIIGLFTAGALFLILAPPDLSRSERPAKGGVGTVVVVMPLGALILLFAGFVAVQFNYLFGQTAPAGHTFSSYAVQGFYQLVTVTVLTLIVIGLAARLAPKQTARDRTVLRGLLGALVLLSLVIVASAVYRLGLYMDAFSWTQRRLLSGAVEIYLGFVFLLVVVAGIRLRAAWFPRAVIASFAVMMLALAVLSPDRFIAERNIDRFESASFDLEYLQVLSSDAVDELDRMDEPYRSCALTWIKRDLDAMPEKWYSWNYSRSHARAVLAERPINPAACAQWRELRERDSRDRDAIR